MSNINRMNQPLNTIQSMFNLGNQPKIAGQCNQNLRFINQESSNSRDRFRLRRAFGNLNLNGIRQFQLQQNSFPITPFRAAFNAGDAYGSINKAPWRNFQNNASNQINLPNHHGVGDGTHTINTDHPRHGSYGASASAYSGNPKFIYDGSDYTKFKKLQAINRNYNDITFGGDEHNASQSVYKRVI